MTIGKMRVKSYEGISIVGTDIDRIITQQEKYQKEGYEVISDGGTGEGWFVEMQKNECIEIDE